ncbi:MAG: ribosome silencing factor [Paludibacteraceae bacterium]|jgi:ribosome-associated protein|nr:ribosome silencing factor [Paludibacteraceae bacterium]
METNLLIDKIIEGIQDVKGHAVKVVDLRSLTERIADAFVICEGSSTTQVSAIADNVTEYVRKETGEKPWSVQGRENAEWVAFDYGNVLVHVFLPEARAFYDLEHLWADAEIREIKDVDDL